MTNNKFVAGQGEGASKTHPFSVLLFSLLQEVRGGQILLFSLEELAECGEKKGYCSEEDNVWQL